MNNRIFGISVILLIIGGLIGSSVALLYAPQSGRATRAMLHSKGVIAQAHASDELTIAKSQIEAAVESLTSQIRNDAAKFSDQLKNTVGSISLPVQHSSNK
ncbi:MAG: YtxH domain-containing protein [Anaerolineaceae bacterium]|nr:YtxH domain-containing protein [Anaerolineaceae bacterium]